MERGNQCPGVCTGSPPRARRTWEIMLPKEYIYEKWNRPHYWCWCHTQKNIPLSKLDSLKPRILPLPPPPPINLISEYVPGQTNINILQLSFEQKSTGVDKHFAKYSQEVSAWLGNTTVYLQGPI